MLSSQNAASNPIEAWKVSHANASLGYTEIAQGGMVIGFSEGGYLRIRTSSFRL
jgi:hypothetical protein